MAASKKTKKRDSKKWQFLKVQYRVRVKGRDRQRRGIEALLDVLEGKPAPRGGSEDGSV